MIVSVQYTGNSCGLLGRDGKRLWAIHVSSIGCSSTTLTNLCLPGFAQCLSHSCPLCSQHLSLRISCLLTPDSCSVFSDKVFHEDTSGLFQSNIFLFILVFYKKNRSGVFGVLTLSCSPGNNAVEFGGRPESMSQCR